MIRRYTLIDIEIMLDHIEKHVKNSRYGKIAFARQKLKDRLVGNIGNSLFFCNLFVDKNDKPFGGFCATISQYVWSFEVYSSDYFFYVNDGKGSTEAATALVESYIVWAKERKVKEALIQNIAGYKPELFAKFVQKMGFKQVGSISTMEF